MKSSICPGLLSNACVIDTKIRMVPTQTGNYDVKMMLSLFDC